MKKRTVSTFSFDNLSDARRGLDNLYRKKIMELRTDDSLSNDDRQRKLDELEHEYMGEVMKLNKRFGIN